MTADDRKLIPADAILLCVAGKVIEMGNISPRMGIKPTSLAFHTGEGLQADAIPRSDVQAVCAHSG